MFITPLITTNESRLPANKSVTDQSDGAISIVLALGMLRVPGVRIEWIQ